MTARATSKGIQRLFAVPSESCGPHAIPVLTGMVATLDRISDELDEEIIICRNFGGTHEALDNLEAVKRRLDRQIVLVMDMVRTELEARR